MQDKKECFICGAIADLHEHHVLFGPFRKKAEHFGLKVFLCPYHHNMSDYGVHFNKKIDVELKKMAQRKFEESHSREEWMRIFEKNYL